MDNAMSIYMEMQDSARERRAAHAGDWMGGGGDLFQTVI